MIWLVSIQRKRGQTDPRLNSSTPTHMYRGWLCEETEIKRHLKAGRCPACLPLVLTFNLDPPACRIVKTQLPLFTLEKGERKPGTHYLGFQKTIMLILCARTNHWLSSWPAATSPQSPPLMSHLSNIYIVSVPRNSTSLQIHHSEFLPFFSLLSKDLPTMY